MTVGGWKDGSKYMNLIFLISELALILDQNIVCSSQPYLIHIITLAPPHKGSFIPLFHNSHPGLPLLLFTQRVETLIISWVSDLTGKQKIIFILSDGNY